jgi:uncharacterized protein (DUF1810 family)
VADTGGFDLERFVQAQAPVWPAVRAELQAGAKRTHWMWFVFPQLASLGRSSTARFYGLQGAAQARAYAEHPLLGPRLREAAALVLAVAGPGRRSVHQVFGSPDDLKLRSCMTLFEAAAPQWPEWAQVLDQCCGGERDPLTLQALGAKPA